MKEFREITPYELENVCRLFDKDWTLITLRDGDRVNAMTASWGGIGILWNRPVAFLFVRPQRHTFSLLQNEERFSLCFLGEEHRDALRICGSKSGRDTDKLSLANLSAEYENFTPFVAQSRLVLFCRKCYEANLERDGFLDKTLLENYRAGDFHRMYIVEIESAKLRD